MPVLTTLLCVACGSARTHGESFTALAACRCAECGEALWTGDGVIVVPLHEPVEVDECLGCPFLSVDRDDGSHCAHPVLGDDRKELVGDLLNPPPDWCPLRLGPITVRLKR